MTKIIMAQNLLLERQTSLISREGYWLIWKLVALWILKICIFFTRETVHYMYFALAAYGWPMYLLHNKTVPVPSAAWKLFSSIRY